MRLKNYVCVDEAATNPELLEEISTADIADSLAIVSNIRCEDLIAFIKAKLEAGKLRNYVVVTSFPARYEKQLVPNNIINVNGKTAEQVANDASWILGNFGKDRKMQDNTWFISDPHFCHSNIIKYCNRPFADVAEMDAEMVKRWNSVVGKDDIVWCLGDFAFGQKENVKRIRSQLNGRINLVLGNHDHHKVSFYYEAGFHRAYDRPVIINGYFILTHAPLEFLNKNCPFFQIFGHVHDSQMYPTYTANTVCLCTERWNYTPVSWKQIREILGERAE